MLDGIGVDQSQKKKGEALRIGNLNGNAGQVLSMDGEVTPTTVGNSGDRLDTELSSSSLEKSALVAKRR